MFFHQFKYKLKLILSDRMTAFWTLFFPIILATLFRISFPDSLFTQFETIPVAVIGADENLLAAMDDSALFSIQETDEQTADVLLADGSVKGIIRADSDGVSLRVQEADYSETILKSFLDTYLQRSQTAATILTADGDFVTEEFLAALNENESFVTEAMAGDGASSMVIYYYGLIGMAVAMSMTIAVDNTRHIQADLSSAGMRVSIAPVNKLTCFAATTAASILMQFLGSTLLLILLKFIFRIDLGTNFPLLLLLCFCGCTACLLFGSLLSLILPFGDGGKVGVIIAITMIGTTCAGTMSPQLRQLAYTYFPPIGYISLPNLIADGFYSMYFHQSVPMVLEKIAVMLVFAVVSLIGSVLILRRQSFKSL